MTVAQVFDFTVDLLEVLSKANVCRRTGSAPLFIWAGCTHSEYQ
jgi:hypothetical protein